MSWYEIGLHITFENEDYYILASNVIDFPDILLVPHGVRTEISFFDYNFTCYEMVFHYPAKAQIWFNYNIDYKDIKKRNDKFKYFHTQLCDHMWNIIDIECPEEIKGDLICP